MLYKPTEKTRQVNWDTLQDYARIEWKRTLSDLKNILDFAYQDDLNEFDSTWERGVGSKFLL